MKRGKLLLAVLIPFLLIGCATIKNYTVAGDFEDSVKAYLNLLRWQEFESAQTTYVSVPLQEEYRRKIKEAGELKIVDYRVKKQTCDPAKGEGIVVAEFDYYRLPSVTVKTVVDNQKWTYERRDDTGSWRLTSPAPNFK